MAIMVAIITSSLSRLITSWSFFLLCLLQLYYLRSVSGILGAILTWDKGIHLCFAQTRAAYQFLDVLSKAMINDGIYKWVNGGVGSHLSNGYDMQ